MGAYCPACGQPGHPEACGRPWGDDERFCAFDGFWLATHRPEACLRPSDPPPSAARPDPRRAPDVVRVKPARPTCPRCRGSLLAEEDDGVMALLCMACGTRYAVRDRVREAALAADRRAARAEPGRQRGRPRKATVGAGG